MEEIHLFIIWEHALDKKEEILEDIKKNFEVIQIYENTWSEDKFSENLSRFYGTNLPKGSGKEQHCGTGPFLLIIVKDHQPKYEMRPTSRGDELVNSNLFDKKTQYRQWTGGGHRIHATNNIEETNHDITLLLGKNIVDFLKETTPSENVVKIEQDLLGAHGWKDANEMFYALNNCISYALLRNYENLPEEIYVNDHNDIDLICESKENCAYILNASKVFAEEYRVHYVTNVENRQAFFDLRYVGDRYYCEEMEKDILKKRIYQEKGFYTIEKEMYFYTLLYHALVHKKVFAQDYKTRLQEMKVENITNNETEETYLNILRNWLIQNGYFVTKPIDISVQFNPQNADKLSVLKKNIMSWYPFPSNSSILKIEDSLEGIAEEQYDYVVLLGTLDYAHKLFFGANPKEQLMEYVKKHLKEEGKLLLAVNNKLGMKRYCERQQEDKDIKTLNRKQLEELLNTCGLNHYKFYYPLSDYKTTNVIFTDQFLPSQETIGRNIALHEEEDFVFQPENDAWFPLLEQDKNLFPWFANSYFVECSRKEFPDNQIEFVSFSNMRKPEYSIRTVIQGDKVYKTAENSKAKGHIEKVKNNIDIIKQLGFQTLDSYEEDVIISEYQKNQETVDDIIVSKIEEGKKEEAIQLIKRFFQEIKDKLETAKTQENVFNQFGIAYEPEQIENLTFTKYGLWDLIFQNAFYKNDQFFFYDQEWMEEGVPIEYIFYRSIAYTNGIREFLKEEDILSQFGLNKKQLDLFLQLDDKLQGKTRNNEVWNRHRQGQTIETLKAQIEHEKQEREKVLEDCKKLLNEKDARIVFLEENMDTTVKLLRQKESEVAQKENEITQIENSVSWKMTKPLRRLRGGNG